MKDIVLSTKIFHYFSFCPNKIFYKHAHAILLSHKCQGLIIEYYQWQAFKNSPNVRDKNAMMNAIANDKMKSRGSIENQLQRLSESQLQSLSESQLQHLSESQLQSLSENQIQRPPEHLVVFGGTHNHRASVMEELLPDKSQWISLQRKNLLSSVRSHTRCAMIDTDDMLLTGGKTTETTNKVCSFGIISFLSFENYVDMEITETIKFQVDQLNLRTLEMTSLQGMQHARSNHGISVENGIIYVAGGSNNEGILKSVEK